MTEVVVTGIDGVARAEEMALEGAGPAAVGQRFLRWFGDEARDEAGLDGHAAQSRSGFEQQRDGSVIDELDRHVGAEDPAPRVQACPEPLV